MELVLYGRPNPKQAEFFASTAAHTAYGGARGGGKSWAMRRKLVLLHTRTNKLTGALLFLLPLSLGFLNISCTAVPLCALASFAAIQEGHFIRTGRDIP